MADIEKVIKGLKECSLDDVDCKHCPYNGEHEKNFKYGCETIMQRDALKLLKEQEKREQAICKEICEFIRNACSTDTEDDKDYVCYVIQNCFKHFCADGVRQDG